MVPQWERAQVVMAVMAETLVIVVAAAALAAIPVMAVGFAVPLGWLALAAAAVLVPTVVAAAALASLVQVLMAQQVELLLLAAAGPVVPMALTKLRHVQVVAVRLVVAVRARMFVLGVAAARCDTSTISP